MRLSVFAILLLSLASPSFSQSIADYIDVAASAAGDFDLTAECECLINKINQGQCNTLCDQTGCENIIANLISCMNPEDPAEQGCDDTCSAILPIAESLICDDPSVSYIFDSGEPICTAVTPTIDYVVDALTLHEDVRAACQSINTIIAEDDACQNTCSATTCTEYLGELQVCAKNAREIDCYLALESLRFHVFEGFLDCQNFDEIDGACRIVHTEDGITNFTLATFDELFPEDFAFVLHEDSVDACDCMIGHLDECPLCNGTTNCDTWKFLDSCAMSVSACDGSGCSENLEVIYNLLTNTSCYLIDDNYNCSASSANMFNCEALSEFDQFNCQSLVNGTDSDEVPDFEQVPSASTSLSPSVTPTNTPTVSFTSSPSPTRGLTPSSSPASAAFSSPSILAMLLVLGAAVLMW